MEILLFILRGKYLVNGKRVCLINGQDFSFEQPKNISTVMLGFSCQISLVSVMVMAWVIFIVCDEF